jgi:inorganic phosphate transporter, PiT family
MGAISYFIANGVGGTAGILVDMLILIAISAGIYWRSRSTTVNRKNVSSEWTGTVAPSATG